MLEICCVAYHALSDLERIQGLTGHLSPIDVASFRKVPVSQIWYRHSTGIIFVCRRLLHLYRKKRRKVFRCRSCMMMSRSMMIVKEQ